MTLACSASRILLGALFAVFGADCNGDCGCISPKCRSQQRFEVARLCNMFCSDFARTPYRAGRDMVLHHGAEVVVGLQVDPGH